VDESLIGLTVGEVLAAAHAFVCGDGPCPKDTASAYNEALTLLHQEVVECESIATGCLVEPV